MFFVSKVKYISYLQYQFFSCKFLNFWSSRIRIRIGIRTNILDPESVDPDPKHCLPAPRLNDNRRLFFGWQLNSLMQCCGSGSRRTRNFLAWSDPDLSGSSYESYSLCNLYLQMTGFVVTFKYFLRQSFMLSHAGSEITVFLLFSHFHPVNPASTETFFSNFDQIFQYISPLDPWI
jgi:hypothetical protein